MNRTLIGNIFKILSIVTLFLFVSCKDNEEIFPHSETNTKITSRTSSISVLDRDYNMEFDYTTENGATIQSMNVETGGSSSPVTLASNVASFNSSVFGTLEAGENEDYDLVSTLSDNYSFRNKFSLAIYKAISATKTPELIRYKSSVEDTLVIKTKTESAIIDRVAVNWKKNKDGVYATDTSLGTLNTDTNTFFFKDVNALTNGYGLQVNDTLYYEFIAESGSLTDTVEVKIPILTQEYNVFSESSSLTTATTSNRFNLKTSETLENDDANAEIKYESGNVAKSGTTAIEFVEISDISSTDYSSNQELVDAKDLLITKDLFDANTVITSFSPSPNKLVGYRITRVIDGVSTTSYGLILITETFSNTSGNGFKFTYGEGTLQ